MVAISVRQTVLMFFALVLSGALLAAEDEPLSYDRVSLSAGAESEIPNDLLTAVLFMQREGSDASQLAADVNLNIEWAVAEAKKLAQVKVRTLEYRTHPVYSKHTLTGWRVRQSIRLESADASALSDLVGRLQQRLAVDSIAYRLSPERRREVENELIQQALDAFSERAKLIAERLGRPEYRLVHINVGSAGAMPRPMYRSAAVSMQAESVSAPAIEPGTQTVEIEISGTIELTVQ